MTGARASLEYGSGATSKFIGMSPSSGVEPAEYRNRPAPGQWGTSDDKKATLVAAMPSSLSRIRAARSQVRHVPAALPRDNRANGERSTLSGNRIGQACVECTEVA